MNFKPGELKLVPVAEVTPGALLEIPEMRDVFPLFLRIANIGDKPGLIALGGVHSLEVLGWDNQESVARVICAPENLRIELKDPQDGYGEIGAAGALVVHAGGAYIQTRRTPRQAHGTRISTSTWAPAESSNEGDVCCFTDWQFGHLDPTGRFVAIYPL